MAWSFDFIFVKQFSIMIWKLLNTFWLLIGFGILCRYLLKPRLFKKYWDMIHVMLITLMNFIFFKGPLILLNFQNNFYFSRVLDSSNSPRFIFKCQLMFSNILGGACFPKMEINPSRKFLNYFPVPLIFIYIFFLQSTEK